MSLKLYLTAYHSLFPVVADCEGRRKEKLNDWAEGTGRTENLIEWRKEQKERRRNKHSKEKAEEKEVVKEAQQAERGQSLAPKRREYDIGHDLYDYFDRFKRRILENDDGEG